jgi:hypothetical protein
MAQRWGTMGTAQISDRWVGRGAPQGRLGAWGGQSGADSAGGGPLVWRRSRGKEDRALAAAFGVVLQTTARHGWCGQAA